MQVPDLKHLLTIVTVPDPYLSQYGSGSSILGQNGSGSGLESRLFHDQNQRNVFVRFFFSVTNCYEDIDWGLPGSSKNHQTFSKWSMLFLTSNLRFFLPFLDTSPGSGSVFPIQIRIQGSHFHRNPPGSGSDTLVIKWTKIECNEYLFKNRVSLFNSDPLVQVEWRIKYNFKKLEKFVEFFLFIYHVLPSK